ncbi:MAG TPA: SusC/RagA family TonB-linked outer membrane protein [Gemmatimonadaceae bacterium]|nr:SusC/RagA family TonB-linked outer membrane protein [Gemmatimonadaceae bacterium]
MRPTHPQRLLGVAGVLLAVAPAIVLAQQPTTIAGRVTTEAGTPIQGASVSIAAIGAGTYSQADGRYSFVVPATRSNGQQATVAARRIGFQPRAVTITLSGGTITQDFSLTAAPTQLNEVVVTALGQSRQKSQVGTAVQQINADELTNTKGQSVVQQLEGKVSGVQITASGTPGGSNMITIRGSNSISGDNTPLYVVDGIPILKANESAAGKGASSNGGFDFGSAINDLNPDDIETLTVLKGPNAAALYGSRAANGAILITTKRGRNSGGRVRTELNTFYTFANPAILPTYQNQYGQGAGGQFAYVNGAGDGVNDGADQSWGPKLDGRTTGCVFIPKTTTYDTSKPCTQFTAITGGPWVAHPNNVADFFQTGHTASATLAVSGGTDKANARLSVGSDNSSSFIPGTYLTKSNASLAGDLQVNDRMSATATVNYIRNAGRNRPGQGYSNSILESFVWFGRQVDMSALKDGWQKSATSNNGPDGREFNWNYNFHNNPFFLMYGNPENDTRDRLIGTVASTYKITDWLNLTGRVGSDLYRYGITQDFSSADITGSGANQNYAGAFGLVNDYNNETNSEALLTANKQVSRFMLNGTFGGNIRQQHRDIATVSTNAILAPGIYNVANSAIAPSNFQQTYRQQVNSVYGSASYTFDGWWTVEGTARNDWSSTLPKGQNSYFYPSVNTSVVLTDAVPALRNRVLSYLKLRASVARVGNDASPYQLITTYEGNSNKFKGQPQYTLGDVLANADLKPEITQSGEFGAEMSFFNGRANVDASYYDKATRNQIFNVTVSPASGFRQKSINSGEITNKGFEALLSVIPVQLSNGLQWTSTFNYSRNQSMVAKLAPGVQTIVLGGVWYVNLEARQGYPYGVLYGNAYARDKATGLIYTDGGLTVAGSRKVLGNIQPRWLGGWSNQVQYKNFTVNALLDMHVGGSLWSVTNWFGDYAGVLKSSLQGRQEEWNKPGVVINGIDINTCPSYDDAIASGACPGGQKNTTNITAEEYYQNIFPVNEGYIYNDTYVKLRELRIGYDLPQRWAERAHASALNIAITGRNLHTWTNVPNVDPEIAYSTDNGTQGQEYGSIPNARTWGISVRVTP